MIRTKFFDELPLSVSALVTLTALASPWFIEDDAIMWLLVGTSLGVAAAVCLICDRYMSPRVVFVAMALAAFSRLVSMLWSGV